MSTIQLTDKFGLDVDVQTDVLSSLQKYAANLSKISLSNLNLQSLADLTLANPSITCLHAGLNFDQPFDIGLSDVAFQLDAGLSGTMDIYVPPTGGGCLFDQDLYGETVAVAPSERYVSVTLDATAGPGITSPVDGLGFHASAKVSLANYRKFETQPSAPTILDSVQSTVAGFCIPIGPDDLNALPADSIVTLEGAGTLTFCATANLLAATNPLATLQLPSPLPELDVSEGGSVTVAANCAVDWDYQLRIRKLDAAHVTVGFYRKQGSETTVSVTASEGISAGTSGTDLFSSIIGAVSKSASANTSALQSLGLPAAQIQAIGTAVTNAAQRKLQVSVLAALTSGDSSSAAFLYEFELPALDAAGQTALAAALRGDLSALTGNTLPAGVQMTRSIATDLQNTGITWKVNLLGIFNFASTLEFVRQGTVTFEPVTGDLVLADKATAQRIDVSTVNFGADSDKLRQVMAESFLITAVYRGSKSLISAPEIACSHSYFELQASTNADAMLTDLAAVTALGLLDNASPQTLVAGITDFGQTMVYAETSYSKELTQSLFLNGAEPKTNDEYQTAGRRAIQLLVRPDASDAFRLRGVSDDQLWAQMCDQGQPGFPFLFPDLTPLEVDVITADYTVIVWWADAMTGCAQQVAAMNQLLASNPDPESPQFVALRAGLAKKLADVSANTKEEFGQPWGLVAMDSVSGRQADAKVLISGARFALARTRVDLPAATGSGSSD